MNLEHLAASFGDARIWVTASGRCCTRCPPLAMMGTDGNRSCNYIHCAVYCGTSQFLFALTVSLRMIRTAAINKFI